MTDSTEKKDVLDLVTESGQLQIALASETLALVKAAFHEGRPMLEFQAAEAMVLPVFLNAFSPRKMQEFKNNLRENPHIQFRYTSMGEAIAPALNAHLERKAMHRHQENEALAAALSQPRKPVG